MVQTFMVVRCFKCDTFQVELVKKSTKWKCKLCAATQSVRQVYGKGMAGDCRRHVQRLNMARGEVAMEQQRAQLSSPPEQYEEDGPTVNEGVESLHPVLLQAEGSSRWAAFISSEHEEVEGEAEDCVETSSGYHFTADVIEYQQEKKKRKKEPAEKDERWPENRSEGMCVSLPEDRSATSVGDVFCKVVSAKEQSMAMWGCRGPEGAVLAMQSRRWDHYIGGGRCVDVRESPSPYGGGHLPTATGECKFSCPGLSPSRVDDMPVMGEGGWEGGLGKTGWKSGSYRVNDT